MSLAKAYGRAAALTAPAKSVYNGMAQRTYAEYNHVQKFLYVLNTASPGLDQVQQVLFWNGNLSGLLVVDGILNGLGFAHEFYRVAYTGLVLRPQWNVTVPNAATLTGDLAMVPTTSPRPMRMALRLQQ